MTAGHPLPDGFLSERQTANAWGMPSASLRYWRIQGYLRPDLVPKRFGTKRTAPMGYRADLVAQVAAVGAGAPASLGGALIDTFYTSTAYTAMRVPDAENPRTVHDAGVPEAASEDAPSASIADTSNPVGGVRW